MQNIRTAMNRGAFDFVTKPVDFEDLQVTIDRTLRHLDEWREAVQSRDKLVALENELDIASKIQQSILPGQFPTVQDFQIYANMEPAREVGGDFYDVIRLDRGQMGLAIADVSGKGVPAALFMMSSRTLLKGTAIGGGSPAEVVAQVNDLLYEQNEAAMFVTVLYAVYDPERSGLTYACAGHDPPLVVHPDGSSTSLPLTGGLALGVVSQFDFGENTVSVAPGDTVVLYTDGVTEAMNGKDEQFGLDRLRETYSSRPPADVKDAISTIFDAVSDFAGDTPQSDDVTCVALHRGGSAT
jgi:sigma-B regulation protein RsbU (phosphoserine phosphatase)